MTINVTCPKCHRCMPMPADVVGKKLRCKMCSETFRCAGAAKVQHATKSSTKSSNAPSLPTVAPVQTTVQSNAEHVVPEVQPNYVDNPLGSLGTPIDRPRPRPAESDRHAARTPKRNQTTKHKKRQSFSWSALEENQQAMVKTGTFLVVLGFLAMILPMFGFTLKILMVIGDFAPIGGLLMVLAGAACMAIGLQSFPVVAAGAGAICLPGILFCVLVMVPVYEKWRKDQPLGANDSTMTTRRGLANQRQLQALQNQGSRVESQPGGQFSNNSGTVKPRAPSGNRVTSPREFNRPGKNTSQQQDAIREFIQDARNRSAGGRRPRQPANPNPALPNVSAQSPSNRSDPVADNPFKDLNPFRDVEAEDSSIDVDNLVFANENVEDFFASEGWFKLKPRRFDDDDRIQFSANREQQLRVEMVEIQSNIDDKFGPGWLEDLPDAFLTKPAGKGSGDRLAGVMQSMIHPEKVPIVGIRYETRNWQGAERIAVILPVFDRQHEDADIVARDGYAVAGVNAEIGDGITRLQFVMMKIDGDRFDPQNKYTTQWIGGRPDNGQTITLAGDGRCVFGFNVNASAVVQGIQLFCDAK